MSGPSTTVLNSIIDYSFLVLSGGVMVQHEMKFPVCGVSYWLRTKTGKSDLAL